MKNGKDLDVEAMSRVCKGCTLNEELRIKDPEADNIWRSAYVCKLNTVKNTYADTEVKKWECVGHVQKRVGCRLWNLKKNKKGLGGKSPRSSHFNSSKIKAHIWRIEPWRFAEQMSPWPNSKPKWEL